MNAAEEKFVKKNTNGEFDGLTDKFVTTMEDVLGTIRIILKGILRQLTGGDAPGATKLAVKNDPLITDASDRYNVVECKGKQYGPFASVLLPDNATNPSNDKMYDELATLLGRIEQGKSVSTIAYGYSGSGKTYTFLGDNKDDPGIIYKYLGTNENITKLEMYARELYGEAKDADTSQLSNMTGRIIEYGNKEDFEANEVSWRGNRLHAGKTFEQSLFVEDGKSWPATLDSNATHVHHLNLVEPGATERDTFRNLYGTVAKNTD
jgi:hypothetical protein